MQGYNFTERVRTVLAMAREEAARLRHEYVGTEHILLGLIREGQGVAVAVLQNLGVDLEEIQQRIEATVKQGKATDVGRDLPYTSRAKKTLELAMTEAHELRHSYVGTEHLLLGLLREEKGIAAQVLVDAGLTLETARAETLRLLGPADERTADDRRREQASMSARLGDSPLWRALPFSSAAVLALQMAEAFAPRRGGAVGPLHLLLALASLAASRHGPASLTPVAETLRERAEQALARHPTPEASRDEAPRWTPGARGVVALALLASIDAGREAAEPDDLVEGLLGEDGEAAALLRAVGIGGEAGS